MKYHHLERCFTYRMKRPMARRRSRRRPSRFGITGGNPTFTGDAFCSRVVCVVHFRVTREDPTVLTTEPIGCPCGIPRVLFRDICQMGSLAGAAYLLHNNAGVLRQAQWEQKSHVEHKRKGLLD